MRSTEHSPRDLYRVFEHRHGLAAIVERGAGVIEERRRVNRPHPERGFMTLAVNASRQRHRFAQQCLGFFEVL